MTNDKDQMTKEGQRSNDKIYDLCERTEKFGEDIIEFIKTIKINVITGVMVGQLIRSATSVGANYAEADSAGSKRDFHHKITICRQESKESKYWLRMLSKAVPTLKSECQRFWNEAHELTLIFSSISLSSRKKSVSF